MQRFWCAAILGFVLPTAVWLAGLAAEIGVPTPSSRWVFEAYAKKTRIADATPAPRVLIVAGSSALFGLDSMALSQAWGRPVVNMAVNAGLGLPYILWQARQVARAGDMILLPLEYALFVDDDRPNAQIVDYTLAHDAAYWHALSPWRKARFAAALAPDRWWQGLRHLDDPPITGGLYGGHHIGAAGDQTHTSPADRSPQEAAEVAASRVWDYGARGKTSRGGWPELAAFARWAQSAHVCLVAVPASFLKQATLFRRSGRTRILRRAAGAGQRSWHSLSRPVRSTSCIRPSGSSTPIITCRTGRGANIRNVFLLFRGFRRGRFARFK